MEGKERQKRVGIMGGTFNPIHIGHLMLAEWAMEEAHLEEVLFIPTGCSYMKQEQKIETGESRLHMVRLAIEGHKGFLCSDIEIKRQKETYTYETLEQLTEENPSFHYYFIMGADCLFTIEKWVHAERIFQLCSILAAVRGNTSIEAMQIKQKELIERFGGQIELFSFPAIELSSSNIRKRVQEGKSIFYMVPDKVRQYIETKKLYQ